MAFNVLRSTDSDRDLELIFDHLEHAYLSLGDTPRDALERAASRIIQIENEMENLGTAPFQGTLTTEILPGLRRVTKSNAVFYFVADEDTETVKVLAIFFGGQNHIVHMLNRLLEE